jgi:ATP-dependent RNA helicase DDX21
MSLTVIIQVASVFSSVACGLSVLTVYGGSAYGPHEAGLRRGVDAFVGTPGRINDYLEKKTSLDLSGLECIILDEADEMLNVGFGPAIEQMLSTAPQPDKRQMLLCSATLPAWMKQVSAKYQKPVKKTVNLVGQQKRQASSSVDHYMMPVFWTAVIGDCFRVYGSGGRTIVFEDTKMEYNELVLDPRLSVGGLSVDSDVLICSFGVYRLPGAHREITLKGFRDGLFHCLVATDVAAPGLDISGVDLVVYVDIAVILSEYVHSELTLVLTDNLSLLLTLRRISTDPVGLATI